MKSLRQIANALRAIADDAEHPEYRVDPLELDNLADRIDAQAEQILIGITEEQMEKVA